MYNYRFATESHLLKDRDVLIGKLRCVDREIEVKGPVRLLGSKFNITIRNRVTVFVRHERRSLFKDIRSVFIGAGLDHHLSCESVGLAGKELFISEGVLKDTVFCSKCILDTGLGIDRGRGSFGDKVILTGIIDVAMDCDLFAVVRNGLAYNEFFACKV